MLRTGILKPPEQEKLKHTDRVIFLIMALFNHPPDVIQCIIWTIKVKRHISVKVKKYWAMLFPPEPLLTRVYLPRLPGQAQMCKHKRGGKTVNCSRESIWLMADQGRVTLRE